MTKLTKKQSLILQEDNSDRKMGDNALDLYADDLENNADFQVRNFLEMAE